MLIFGVLYITFEQSILAQVKADSSLSSPGASGISRAILGVQIGLIALAMVVTRSSVASLQAKQGLPLGTQIVGWIVLGMLLDFTTSTL